MPTFDECCVLIPSATLEDFPVKVSDSEACSMLAAWTVLWHPRLLAESDQIPTWYRADSPPEPTIARLITVPESSIDLLPERYQIRCEQKPGGKWVTGATRAEMLAALGLGDQPQRLRGDHRSIGVEDFFAAGFTMLQIQIMTRRLRYTSNIDEIYLQGRAVAAANAFIDGNAQEAIDALHAFFDSLAEERDHYFSSDPHLVDLTLLTPSTLTSLLSSGELDPPTPIADESPSSVLSTPLNVLIDAETADAIGNDPDRFEPIRKALASGQIGWAGGGPDATVSLDLMTLSQAEQALEDAIEKTTKAVGVRPEVFARFSGETPADLTPQLVRTGYAGMIPIDFAAGTGFGDEAKVLRQAGGAQIESLTAKPIDAASDASFMDLGPRLGEAIDSGEVATGLLAHWPGLVCDSYRDLRCAASWTLALGRFWKLGPYFLDGERPYHHANGRAATADSALRLSELVKAGGSDPLSKPAAAFRKAIVEEADRRTMAMIDLVRGSTEKALAENDRANQSDEPSSLTGCTSSARGFAIASGARLSEDNASPPKAVMVLNPHDAADRKTVSINAPAPKSSEHVYASSDSRSGSDVTVDVPALGFAIANGGDGSSTKGSFIQKIFGKSKSIAEQWSLQNEFMEVVISPSTGGIQGVYSGATRGNRFSMRITHELQLGSDQTDSLSMICNELRLVESSAAVGTIEASGALNDATGKQLCKFKLQYTLHRGSRLVKVTGSLSEVAELGDQAWKNYIGLRAAVSSESSIYRVILRDKIHRGTGRRLVAPLGVVIDEAERQTLVASGGLPFHRRVGDRYLDTFVAVRGESELDFAVSYGFDVRSPVPVAKSVISPSPLVPIINADALPGRGWIVHSSPRESMVGEIRPVQRTDGCLAALVRIIQTRSKPTATVIRFCRDVHFARVANASSDKVDWNVDAPATSTDEAEDANTESSFLHVDKDSVRVPMSGHQVADILVVFKSEA